MAHPPNMPGASGVTRPDAGSLILGQWNWRAEALLPLVVLAGLYVTGWWRLSSRSSARDRPWRLGAALAGLLILGVALLSPLDALSDQLFTAHMIQHVLLMMVAAPALLLADPLPAVLWALPRPVRLGVGRRFAPGARVRQVLAAVTWAPFAWTAYVLVLWLWHVPVAYDSAVLHRVLHDLEHVTFFAAAIVFWWPIIRPAPHVRGRLHGALQILYLILAAFQNALLGLLLASAPRVVYTSYGEAPGTLGWEPLEDQMIGGIIMWAVGSAIDMLAVLVVLYRFLRDREPGSAPARASLEGSRSGPAM